MTAPVEMSVEVLSASVRKLLDATEPFVDAATRLKWSPVDGFLPLILRATVRRQFDCLASTVELVSVSRGYAAAPLLRPACEEFIWTKYLMKLKRETAERLIKAVAQSEMLASLEAQDTYAGRKISKELGLSKYLTSMQRHTDHLRSEFRSLGTELDWGKREIEAGRPPTVNLLAKKTGETKLYNLLYHASSRFVHFSPSELLRRTWGKDGEVSIHSTNFGKYWAAFALHWGAYVFSHTVGNIAAVIEDSFDYKIDGNAVLAAAEAIGSFGVVPIVTAEELAWER
jgi:hypothetical protein